MMKKRSTKILFSYTILALFIFSMTSAMAENETEYGDITDEIGGTYDSIFGSTLLIGIVIFLFFFIVTLLLGLGMLVGSVVLLPSLFIVFEFIPSLRIIVAIALGLIFGLALNKLIRR